MKIRFEKYNPVWKQSFEQIKNELTDTIGFISPRIEHIGSTSVEGLSAKPIIDILVGLKNDGDLDKTIRPLTDKGYIYYEKYNTDMPYRRFFVRLKDNAGRPESPVIIRADDEIPDYLADLRNRLAHIHILTYNSEHWTRHIAFRDYLRSHPHIREEYRQLKELLSAREWRDGNEYNEGKDDFMKREERNAIEWYKNNYK